MEDIYHKQHLTHLALVQYYRWYQVYEVPFTAKRIDNQKDILADDVEIITSAGISKGKAGIDERLKVYEGWLNAHHVQNTRIDVLTDGMISLEADIVYQNIRPDQSQYSYTIHYSTLLQTRVDDLPVFTKLELKPTGEVKPFVFEPAYAANRCLSFIHYWVYLLDIADGNSAKFKELLADNFSWQISSGDIIDTFDKFDAWVKSIPTRVITSHHTVKNFSVVDNKDNTFNVSVDFDWEAVTVHHEKMTAETHQDWLLENDMDERFARLKTMRTTVIKPFSLVAS